MKYWLMIIVIVVLGGGVAKFWYLNHATKPVTATQTPVADNTSTHITHWGAVVRPYGLKHGGVPYAPAQFQAQIDLVKSLGSTDIRANAEDEAATNDDFVNFSLKDGLVPTIVLEPIDPNFLDKDTYKNAYNYAFAIATRYQGKVPYYQLANEASGVAIKNNAPGNKITDYDEQKYQKLKLELQGLGDGVAAADPKAQRIVSANWEGVGVIDRLMSDKVNFEIIGWNWYSDMGDDMIKTLDDGSILNIPEYLKHYNKQFWVVELNRREGTFDNKTKAQADFIQTFVTNAESHHNVGAIFVFTLTDQCADLDKQTGHLGLVNIIKNKDNTCSIGTNKPAFATFQQLIAQNSK